MFNTLLLNLICWLIRKKYDIPYLSQGVQRAPPVLIRAAVQEVAIQEDRLKRIEEAKSRNSWNDDQFIAFERESEFLARKFKGILMTMNDRDIQTLPTKDLIELSQLSNSFNAKMQSEVLARGV